MNNPERITCKCGKGKMSAWDNKCGHCRTNKDIIALQRMQDHGWSYEEAQLGHRYKPSGKTHD